MGIAGAADSTYLDQGDSAMKIKPRDSGATVSKHSSGGVLAALSGYCAMASLLAVLAAPVQADPAAAGPPSTAAPERQGELEEITVTAEKRDSTVQATPISLTAVTGNDLAEQNISSVQDLVGKI